MMIKEKIRSYHQSINEILIGKRYATRFIIQLTFPGRFSPEYNVENVERNQVDLFSARNRLTWNFEYINARLREMMMISPSVM